MRKERKTYARENNRGGGKLKILPLPLLLLLFGRN
jgi:hypothetical protein